MITLKQPWVGLVRGLLASNAEVAREQAVPVEVIQTRLREIFAKTNVPKKFWGTLLNWAGVPDLSNPDTLPPVGSDWDQIYNSEAKYILLGQKPGSLLKNLDDSTHFEISRRTPDSKNADPYIVVTCTHGAWAAKLDFDDKGKLLGVRWDSRSGERDTLSYYGFRLTDKPNRSLGNGHFELELNDIDFEG